MVEWFKKFLATYTCDWQICLITHFFLSLIICPTRAFPKRI
jgi:hypothetical protein